MHLTRLQLFQFKNHLTFESDFSENLTCIVGENGVGKSNLLDAIYFACLTKSGFSSSESSLPSTGTETLSVIADFVNFDKKQNIKAQIADKKTFSLNNKPYDRLADHIGHFPVVLVSPNDTDLIRDGSETRRKFFDGVLCQMDAVYLEAYQKYQKHLEARNRLLKDGQERRNVDMAVLSFFDKPLIENGRILMQKRAGFIQVFNESLKKNYQTLGEGREEANLEYMTGVNLDSYENDFKKALKTDIESGRTSYGVHKDQYEIQINAQLAKKMGSQGQQKAMVLAMKLAQRELLFLEKKNEPILLLDDIFDKLDERRIASLANLINEKKLGQVIITDASPSRSKTIFEKISYNYKTINL